MILSSSRFEGESPVIINPAGDLKTTTDFFFWGKPYVPPVMCWCPMTSDVPGIEDISSMSLVSYVFGG